MRKIIQFIPAFVILFACNTKQNSINMTPKQLLPAIQTYVEDHQLAKFDGIAEERKQVLNGLVDLIAAKNDSVKLTFICTHNSRRSHMSQLWAQAASAYYGIDNIDCFSGGTESTAFNPRAVKAMKDAGFDITSEDSIDNPIYTVNYAEGLGAISAFSKKYDDEFNPQGGYIAIMTCDHANEACPVVFGAESRVAILYVDPKEADGTPEEEARYAERCEQIGNEMFYVFSEVKQKINE